MSEGVADHPPSQQCVLVGYVTLAGGAADRIVGVDAGGEGPCAASGRPDIAAVETEAGALSAAARPS